MPDQLTDLRSLPWRADVDTTNPHWAVSRWGNLRLVHGGATFAQVSFCSHERDWSAHITGGKDRWDVGSLQRALAFAGAAYPNAPFLGPLAVKKSKDGDCPSCGRDQKDW